MSAQPTITAAELPKGKRKPKVTTMTLTKDRLRSEGYDFEVVEHRIPTTFISRDFLNAFDLLAWNVQQEIAFWEVSDTITGRKSHVFPGGLFRAIQVTDASDISKRRHKIDSNPRALAFCAVTGASCEVWGWSCKAGRWVLTMDCWNGQEWERV